MFKNILGSTDLTEESFKAVEVGTEPCRRIHRIRSTLLHVIETIDDAEPDEFEKFYEKAGTDVPTAYWTGSSTGTVNRT